MTPMSKARVTPMIPAQAMQGGQIESVNTPLEAKPPTDQAKPSTLSTPSFKKRPVQMLTPGRVNLVKRKIINNSGEAKSPKTGDNAAEGDAQSKNFTPDPLLKITAQHRARTLRYLNPRRNRNPRRSSNCLKSCNLLRSSTQTRATKAA